MHFGALGPYLNSIDAGFSCRDEGGDEGALYGMYSNNEKWFELGTFTDDTVLELLVDGDDFKWYVDGELRNTLTGVLGVRASTTILGPLWPVALTQAQNSGYENIRNFHYITAPGTPM